MLEVLPAFRRQKEKKFVNVVISTFSPEKMKIDREGFLSALLVLLLILAVTPIRIYNPWAIGLASPIIRALLHQNSDDKK